MQRQPSWIEWLSLKHSSEEPVHTLERAPVHVHKQRIEVRADRDVLELTKDVVVNRCPITEKVQPPQKSAPLFSLKSKFYRKTRQKRASKARIILPS